MSSLSSRIKKLQNHLKKGQVIFLSNPFNVFYFSGMKSSHAYMLVDRSGGQYFTDFRYLKGALEKIKHMGVFNLKDKKILEFIKEKQYDELIFEEDIPYRLYKQLQEACVNLVPAGILVQKIRMQKDSNEIALMTNAIRGVSWAFQSLVDYLKVKEPPGITEWDIVKFLRRRLEELDWEDFSFSPIVAFDENSALPHYSYSHSKCLSKTSKLILVDFGFYYHSYASDFTRVIFLQSPPKELAACHKLLQEAFILFEEQFSSLKTMADIDLFFRSVIKEAGYEEYFQHATGHGIGLECHEYPSLSSFSESKIINNVVFTVEPGIYLPGQGGVRIEDMYTVQNGKLVKLTPSSREMIVL